jgi:trehalose synthase-fused probable maltokinase
MREPSEPPSAASAAIAASATPATIATLAAWLPQARWFAGKHADGARAISVHDELATPAGKILLVDVAVGAGEPERYVVPVDAAGVDAAASPAFATWLVRVVRGGLRVEAGRGAIVGRLVGTAGGGGATATPAITAVHLLGVDASNTSLLVDLGEAGPGLVGLVFKLLRRCRPGIQPEVEVGEFLALHTPWSGAARLRGWLEYVPSDAAEAPTVLATIHDAVPASESAWDRLGPLVAGGGLHGPDRDRVLAIVGRLGRATAEMHAALASRPDIPAFAPEPATTRHWQAEAAGMVARLAAVARLARERADRHPEPLRGRLLRFAEREGAFASRLKGLATFPADLCLIRIHGDYHLGQVLLDATDAPAIIDFEGEPGRPLADRRAKVAACRDVAGMCRSFDYLLRHAALHGGRPWQAADLRLLETTFLTAYAAHAAGGCWWPARDVDLILEAFTLDKAIYELAYEMNHRPDWIDVPLAALDAA